MSRKIKRRNDDEEFARKLLLMWESLEEHMANPEYLTKEDAAFVTIVRKGCSTTCNDFYEPED